MLIFDFNRWLGSEQFLGAASDVLFQTNPQSTSGVWIPFPGGGCCLQDTQAAPPPDTNPLSLAGLTIMPDGKRVELSLSAGTPGLAYLASFIATAGPYARRKEVGVIMTCFALRPYPGVVLPPPPPTTSVGGSTTLPVGTQGSININNTSGAMITITLPPSPVLDQRLAFKDIAGNASTYPIRILPQAGATIDSKPDFYMYQDYQAMELYWTSSGWGVR